MGLKIKFFDIGHGSSVLIKSDKINMLFDLGSDTDKTFNPFPNLNGDLDFLIITHPHMDHISSLKYMYKFYEPKTLLINEKTPDILIEDLISNTDTEEDANIYRKYNDLKRRFTKPVSNENNPALPENNGGATIYSFKPQKEDIEDINYYSVSTLIEYEGFKIFLMGDNTKTNLDEIKEHIEFYEELNDIDVLLAPHHGHESEYDEEFVKHLNPQITIISDKEDENIVVNDYKKNSRGFPVEGYSSPKKYLTTYENGEINIEIKNNNMTISCAK